MELQRNTTGLGLIPSHDSVKRHILKLICEPLTESGFTKRRFDHAFTYFASVGYKGKAFLLTNDATALLPAIGYRASDDSLHGYAISDEQLPHVDLRAGLYLDEFLAQHLKLPLATQVELVILVPLAPNTPPYIVAAFAQAAPPSKETLQMRLTIAREEMKKRGALIVNWSADGASGHVKYMKELNTPKEGEPIIAIHGVATLKGDNETVILPARVVIFEGERRLLSTVPILDPVHLLNLLRSSPLRAKSAMGIGPHGISFRPLKEFLLSKLGAFRMENELGVRPSDFSAPDRMNYASAQRVFNTKVLEFVEAHRDPNELQGE
jgi:hypothetical protein